MGNQKTIDRNGATSPERPQTGGVARHEISHPASLWVTSPLGKVGACLMKHAKH